MTTETLPPADQVELGESYELSTQLIALEVMRRGYEPVWLRRALFVVDVDGAVYGWNMTRCSITSTVGAELATRKDYARTLLRRAGLPVADGGSYRPDEYDRALTKARRVGWPVVVKPSSSSGGRGVTVGVDSEDAFREAWQRASRSDRKIVIERQQAGTEARFLTVSGRCMAVAGRIPAHVVGDGTSTVAELVERKNEERSVNPHLRRYVLEARGDPVRVPDVGEMVLLDPWGRVSFSTGADSRDLTDDVHPSYLDVAGRAELAFPQLGLAGVDIIAADFTQPATPGNHIVVEVNSRPAIGSHHFPWEGKPRDVAAAIVDACFSSTR